MPLNFKTVIGKKFCRMSSKRYFLIYEESWQNIQFFISVIIDGKYGVENLNITYLRRF